MKQLSLPKIKKVLVIFPHPDDETFACSAAMAEWANRGVQVDLCVFTKGECGVEGAVYTPSLKEIRTKELQQSAKAIGVTNLYQFDYGDGHVGDHQKEISTELITLLKHKYDIVITYDESGLYGHPDHIVISQLTTKLIKTQFPQTTLWYTTKSPQQLADMKLPTHMATDTQWITKRTQPDIYITPTIGGLIAKIKSLYAHKSQHFAFIKNKPKWVPLWVIPITQAFEYFAIAHQGEKI